METVSTILENLKQGIFTHKAKSDEKAALQAQAAVLRYKRDELVKTQSQLKASETYQLIEQIQDWDVYFAIQKSKLEDVLSEMLLTE